MTIGKHNLKKLYANLYPNREGISNQFILKEKGVEKIGTIELNINKAIFSHFKKKEMNWSRETSLVFLKIKEDILNGE